jgi:hypothetical protein
MRTPESNPLKYLQSKNEYKFSSMVSIVLGTFCMASKRITTGLTVLLSYRANLYLVGNYLDRRDPFSMLCKSGYLLLNNFGVLSFL